MKYLVELLGRGLFEDKECEFKIKLEKAQDKAEDWLKTIVGFANSDGGTMYVGVSDDGAAVGMGKKEVDESKNLVLRMIDRCVFPHVEVRFDVVACDEDKFVLSVGVEPSEEITVYKVGDYNEKAYIRENGASVPANVKQILKLGKRKYGVDRKILDEQYRKSDYQEFNALGRMYRKDEREPSLELLISEEVVTPEGRVSEGLKMFSDSFTSDDTLISCRIWNGYNKGVDEVIDRKDFKGNLCFVFSETMAFLRRGTRTGFIKTKNGGRLDTYSYPEQALREAVVNAIAHRDYSIEGTQVDVDVYKNRIVITSPGSWLLSKEPKEYDLHNVPSVRRNKIICNCFECLGLMEETGSGFRKIYEAYKEFDSKQPLLEDFGDFFTLTLFDLLYVEEPIKGVSNTTYALQILEFCRDCPRSREEIQNHIGFASRSHFATDLLNPLIKEGLIMPIAPGKSRNQKYLTVKH